MIRFIPILFISCSAFADLNSWNDGTNASIRVNGILAQSITNTALTASRAVVSGSDKSLSSSATTAAELDFVSGVTSAIQTQLNAKASTASVPTAANPTATIGSSAVNGSASTFMRSDGAPALGTVGTAGTYRSVTTDANGRVTAGTTPTTFSGYAISDSSANLASALTDETGSGVAVFGTSPTITTSLTITNATTTVKALVINGVSSASSNQFEVNVGGTAAVRINANGAVLLGPTSSVTDIASTSAGTTVTSQGSISGWGGGSGGAAVKNNFSAASGSKIGWVSGSGITGLDPTLDTGFARDAAAVVRVTDGSTGVGTLKTGGFQPNLFTTTTNYTAAATDYTILANGTTLTITLPTAASVSGKMYTVKVIANTSATVATTSSQNIDGASTYSLSAQYKYVTVQSNGTQWYIVANN